MEFNQKLNYKNMKNIKVHIPTEQYGYVEIEFESYEEYVSKYAEIYNKTKVLTQDVYNELHFPVDKK